MDLAKIILLDRDGKSVIGQPEILWPPSDGIPDVLQVAGSTFVLQSKDGPRYRRATVLGITNFDFDEMPRKDYLPACPECASANRYSAADDKCYHCGRGIVERNIPSEIKE
jgi:hypothetical protein